MSYYTVTVYECMECGTKISQKAAVKHCAKCSMDLCLRCSKKHKKLCIWCYNRASDESLWLHKLTSIMMGLIPLIAFLLPAPYPIIFLLFSNSALWLYALGYMLFLYLVVGIIRSIATKKIIASVPDPSLDVEESEEELEKTRALPGSQPASPSGVPKLMSPSAPFSSAPAPDKSSEADEMSFSSEDKDVANVDSTRTQFGPFVPRSTIMEEENSTTVTPAPSVPAHPESVSQRSEDLGNICPECGYQSAVSWSKCPNCSAEMNPPGNQVESSTSQDSEVSPLPDDEVEQVTEAPNIPFNSFVAQPPGMPDLKPAFDNPPPGDSGGIDEDLVLNFGEAPGRLFGSTTSTPRTTVRTCLTCRNTVPPDSNVCPYCGTVLKQGGIH